MGIKTVITLNDAQLLFPDFALTHLLPTQNGVIDTTYIASSQEKKYILKKYEQATSAQIIAEESLLRLLTKHTLNVPNIIASNQEWRLLSFFDGVSPVNAKSLEIRAIGRFLAKMHRVTQKRKSAFTPFSSTSFKDDLKKVRKLNLTLTYRFKTLYAFNDRHDGIIHGDLFPDNAKHNGKRLAVFDFIEAGNGAFDFDLGVVASSWLHYEGHLRHAKFTLLLKSYNQYAPRKITTKKLIKSTEDALLVYALKRYLAKAQNKEAVLCYRTLLRRYHKFGFYQRKMKNTDTNKQ